MTLSVYILVALYSVVFAYRRLNRPGVSKEIRLMFIKKHFVYVVVFIFVWVIQLTQNYRMLFNPSKLTGLDQLGVTLGFRNFKSEKDS